MPTLWPWMFVLLQAEFSYYVLSQKEDHEYQFLIHPWANWNWGKRQAQRQDSKILIVLSLMLSLVVILTPLPTGSCWDVWRLPTPEEDSLVVASMERFPSLLFHPSFLPANLPSFLLLSLKYHLFWARGYACYNIAKDLTTLYMGPEILSEAKFKGSRLAFV